MKIRLLVTGFASIIMAFLSAHFLFDGAAWNMIPWGILAVTVGLNVKSKRESLFCGAIFGYILSFSFLWFDKTDATSKQEFEKLLILIGIVSLFGALCGLLLSWFAYSMKTRLQK